VIGELIGLGALAAAILGVSIALKQNKQVDSLQSQKEAAERRIARNLVLLCTVLGAELYDKLAASGKRGTSQNALELLMKLYAPYDEIVLAGGKNIFGWKQTLGLTAEQIEAILRRYLVLMEKRKTVCFEAISTHPKVAPQVQVDANQKWVQDELQKELVMPIMAKRGR